MSDRVSDLISIEGCIKPIRKYPKTITFRKSAFILSCCIGAAFIIGGSVGTTAYIVHLTNNTYYRDCYNKSILSAKTFSENKLKNSPLSVICNYPINDYCLFNLYETNLNDRDYYIYQIYTIKQLSSNISIKFTHEDLSKEIVLTTEHYENIGILNDIEFNIQEGAINGLISFGDENAKEIIIIL